MILTPQLVAACRAQFPGLARQIQGRSAAFFDGPAGTQVPRCVIEAVSHCLATTNANHGGLFATSLECDAMLDEAHRAAADLFGASDAGETFFGQNSTSLIFALSRALARTWQTGDELVVTRLDHDANIAPWLQAARDAGARVRFAEIDVSQGTLNLESLRGLLGPRTRLVAVGAASNALGTVNDIRAVASLAHAHGALVLVDAVHFAPHGLCNVAEWQCDFAVCSAYKFFGPHVGLMWGRRDLLERLEAYKVRPAPDSLPGKWMTGTQNHEGIAGVLAAINYLANLGRTLANSPGLPRRAALAAGFEGIAAYERELTAHLLAGLAEIPAVQVWGITDPSQLANRLPTVSLTHRQLSPTRLAGELAARGIFVWHGNNYALETSTALGREPEGMVRIGLVHYNTPEEIDRLLAELRSLAP